MLPLPPPIRAYTCLPRRLISVVGQDAAKFLNGIVTNKVTDQDPRKSLYAGFLNAKGRIIADSFIYPADSSPLVHNPQNLNAYIVDCDEAIASDLLRTLKVYKLRAKVKISALDPDSYKVFSVWDESHAAQRSFPLSVNNSLVMRMTNGPEPYIGADDSRAPGFGIRLVTSSSVSSPLEIMTDEFAHIGDLSAASVDQYAIRRYLYGIPEGSAELPPYNSLPLDSCMDYMGGIDFNKGCYVGQELTIRSHHHGIVRKRIIPVVVGESDGLVYDPSFTLEIPTDSDILSHASLESSASGSSPFGSSSQTISKRRQRPSGNILNSIGNVGLALVRLEHFAKPDASFYVKSGTSEIPLKGFVPFWWP